MEEKTRHWIVLAAEWTRLDSPARPMRGRGGEGRENPALDPTASWNGVAWIFYPPPRNGLPAPPQFLLGSEMGSKARTGFPCWLECTEWGQGSPLPLSLPPQLFHAQHNGALVLTGPFHDGNFA